MYLELGLVAGDERADLEHVVQGFQQYMGAVQQYGGYRQMPLGYQDVMRCIQMQGSVPNSPYAKYVQRMTRKEAER